MSNGSSPCPGLSTRISDSHVYLVARRVGVEMQAPLKIGVTDDLPTLVGTLQDCCPFAVTLVHAVRFPDGHVVANLLHDRFADRHGADALGRGWFGMAPAVALRSLLAELDAILAVNGVQDDERQLVLDFLEAGGEAQEALRFLTSPMGEVQ